MKHFYLPILFCLFFVSSQSQTNVSGGIFSNTTWYKVNSPYIVTDTIVVFPGVSLTIQPGVIVKFNQRGRLEIRQGQIIANGISTDSITFTSNGSLTHGYWSEVAVPGGGISSFRFCNFLYAERGVGGDNSIKRSTFKYNTIGYTNGIAGSGIVDSCVFLYNTISGATGVATYNNCNFFHNQTGVSSFGQNFLYMNNCVVRYNQTGVESSGMFMSNCIVNQNQTGIAFGMSLARINNTVIDSNAVIGLELTGSGMDAPDTIENCLIRHNGLGIKTISTPQSHNVIAGNTIENNSIGIFLDAGDEDSIYCNKICNNTTYNLKYTASTNTNWVRYNYWCGDSAATQLTIYDAHNNISSGLVTFMPMDNSCYQNFGIRENTVVNSLSIFPNPASANITISSDHLRISKIEITDILGNAVTSLCASDISNMNTAINVSKLPDGVYFVNIKSSGGPATKKIIVQH